MDTECFHGISYLCSMKFVHYIKRPKGDRMPKSEYVKFAEDNALELFCNISEDEVREWIGDKGNDELFYYGFSIPSIDPKQPICLAVAERKDINGMEGKGIYVKAIYADKRLFGKDGSRLIDISLDAVVSDNAWRRNSYKHFDYAWYPNSSMVSEFLHDEGKLINTETYGTVVMVCPKL